ncbi:MAG: MFS transporter, partial [Actinomycetales bacterium]
MAAGARQIRRGRRGRRGRGGRHRAVAAASLSTRALLRSNGEVRALLAAQGLSEVGDWISRVSLATVVLAATQSVLLTAATFAISFLPSVLGGVLLGGLADRFPRRDVLLACDLIRALAVLWLTVAVTRGLAVGVLLALLAFAELFSAPFLAARSALLPDLVDEPRQYSTANSASRVLTMGTQVFGFIAAGLVVQLLGVRTALLVDAASFAVSMLLLTRVRRGAAVGPDTAVAPDTAAGPATPGARAGRLRRYARELRAGADIVLRDPVRRSLVLLGWGSAVVLIAPEAVALAYAHERGMST